MSKHAHTHTHGTGKQARRRFAAHESRWQARTTQRPTRSQTARRDRRTAPADRQPLRATLFSEPLFDLFLDLFLSLFLQRFLLRQRKFGNSHIVGPAPKKKKKQYWIPQASREKKLGRKLDALERRSAEELEALEDEFDIEAEEDDEAAIEAYRRARLAQLKARATAARFGEVRALSRSEYVREVTEASQESWVLLHMYQNRVSDCQLLDRALRALAPKFPDVKFLEIIADECVEGYPDEQCPALMVYHLGECKKQFVTLREFGGGRMTVDDVEWQIAQLGAWSTEIEEDPASVRPSLRVTMGGSGAGAAGRRSGLMVEGTRAAARASLRYDAGRGRRPGEGGDEEEDDERW